MPNINDARVLIIATDGVEQAELITPRDELRKAGAKVDVATPSGSRNPRLEHDRLGRQQFRPTSRSPTSTATTTTPSSSPAA